MVKKIKGALIWVIEKIIAGLEWLLGKLNSD